MLAHLKHFCIAPLPTQQKRAIRAFSFILWLHPVISWYRPFWLLFSVKLALIQLNQIIKTLMKESVPLYTPLYVLKGNQFDKGGAKSDKLCEEWDVWYSVRAVGSWCVPKAHLVSLIVSGKEWLRVIWQNRIWGVWLIAWVYRLITWVWSLLYFQLLLTFVCLCILVCKVGIVKTLYLTRLISGFNKSSSNISPLSRRWVRHGPSLRKE